MGAHRSAPPRKNKATAPRHRWALRAGAIIILLFLIFSAGRIMSKRKIPTIRLRSSGLAMPAVGYGTCCRESAKGDAIYESTRTFLRHGGRLIDTAMAYDNHIKIGWAVRDSGVPRSEIWITSKVSPGKVRNYDDCLDAVDGILGQLGMDYLDLLLIHGPQLGKEMTIDLWKCLIASKRLGKVRSIGVSNFNRGEIEDVARATGGEMPDANEIQQHPWSSPAWRELARWQKENGIATIAYTSLGGSMFHKSDCGTNWPPEVTGIAERHDVTEAQVLLKWALRRDIAVIPGSGREDHIRENLLLSNFDLSDAELMDIEGADVPDGWWDPKRSHQKYTDEEASLPWAKKKNEVGY